MAGTNSTAEAANVDATDAIADLLMGDEEVAETKETVEAEVTEETEQDDDDAVELSEESTEEVEESDEVESDVTWAGALGLDDSKIVLDDEGELAGINVKVDGEVSMVNMNDLITGFQSNKSNTNKSKSLADDRRQLDEQLETVTTDYRRKLHDVAKLSEYMNNNLMSEFKNVDWNNLRASDPAEYAASMQDYNKRQADIQRIQQAIEQEYQVAQTGQADKIKGQDEALVAKNVSKMLENNPEWTDQAKLQEAFTSMSEFTTSTYGFTSDEFNEVTDSRMIELIKDAQKYRKGEKIASAKMVKKVPKFQKSKGKTAKRKVTKLDTLTKRAKAAHGNDRRDLQTSAIAELLTGGV